MLTVLTYLLMFVEILVSLLLICVILIQRTKSQGMGLAFGSSMGESLFGAQVGNVLTKTTVILAVVFLLNTTALSLLGSGRRRRGYADGVKEQPVATAPAAPVGAPNAPAVTPGPDVSAQMEPLPAEADIPLPPAEEAPSVNGEDFAIPEEAAEPAPAPPADE